MKHQPKPTFRSVLAPSGVALLVAGLGIGAFADVPADGAVKPAGIRRRHRRGAGAA